jgi:hypothetical protein
MRGQRHLIKCRCVLPQFKNRVDPPRHHFVVFSAIDDNDNVVVKYSLCNNCGSVHKIIDLCKSEILQGKENMSSVLSIDDIKQSLPTNLVDILERNSVDITCWEQAKFIIENKLWGEFVLLGQEEESGTKQGKYVVIMSETFFKIESFSREDVLVPNE